MVLLAIAAAATAEGLADAPGTGEALAELAIGGLVGAAVGAGGGWLLQRARSAGWASEDFAGIAVLALALLACAAARGLHGNGFIAAFCGGVAFGAAAGRRGRAELVFLEQAGGLVSLLVWLAFGAVAVPLVLERADLMTVLYAVLSLTAVRMLPVAVATARAGLDWETVLFVGWFGPGGLPRSSSRCSRSRSWVPAPTMRLWSSPSPWSSVCWRMGRPRGPWPGGTGGPWPHGGERGGGVADLPVRGLPRPAGDSRGR